MDKELEALARKLIPAIEEGVEVVFKAHREQRRGELPGMVSAGPPSAEEVKDAIVGGIVGALPVLLEALGSATYGARIRDPREGESTQHYPLALHVGGHEAPMSLDAAEDLARALQDLAARVRAER